MQIIQARNTLLFWLTDVPGSIYTKDKTTVANKMGENEAILMLLNGLDLMAFDPATPYTHKSQYLLNAQLTGNYAANLTGNDKTINCKVMRATTSLMVV